MPGTTLQRRKQTHGWHMESRRDPLGSWTPSCLQLAQKRSSSGTEARGCKPQRWGRAGPAMVGTHTFSALHLRAASAESLCSAFRCWARRAGPCEKWPQKCQRPGRCGLRETERRGAEFILQFGVTEEKLRACLSSQADTWLHYLLCDQRASFPTSLSLLLFNCNMQLYSCSLPNLPFPP